MDEELRIALSRKEKVELFLSNLEKLREDGSVTEVQYQDLQSEYRAILEEANNSVKSIKARLRTEFERKAEELENAQREQELWHIRFNVREIRSETYWAQVKPLRKKIEQLKKEVPKLQTLVSAKSTAEIGGAAKVNIPELKVRKAPPKPEGEKKPAEKPGMPVQSPIVAEKTALDVSGVQKPPAPSRDKALVSELFKEPVTAAAPRVSPPRTAQKPSARDRVATEGTLNEYPEEQTARTPGKLAAIVVAAAIVIVIVIFAIGRAVSSPADSTAPVISGFTVSPVTGSSATIEWTTNEQASSQVILRDPGGASLATEKDKTMVTRHSVKVGNLKPAVKYRVTLKSADARGNEAVYEADQTFVSAAQSGSNLPVISDVSVSDVTDTSAVITWKTDRPATRQAMVSEVGSKTAILTELQTDLTMSHAVTVTNLKPNVTYTITLLSKDASGNQVMHDPGKTFATLASSPAEAAVGKLAPDFTLPTLDGKTLTLSSFRGKVVMINFWQKACPACVREMPMMQTVFTKLPADKVVVLAVNAMEDEATVKSFKERWNLTFPILLDTQRKVVDAYKVDDIPVTLFLNSQGIIKEIKVGPFQSAEEIENSINSLLKESGR